MLITPANLNIFFTALETRFWTSVGTTPVYYDRLTTTFPVGTEVWLSGWLDMIDKVREWVGPRITHTPALTNTKASSVPTLVISSNTLSGITVAKIATKMPTTMELR